MIDFDKGVKLPNKFYGSEKKTTIAYEGCVYMVKYPDPIRENKRQAIISYKNNQFSEHIGSLIFKSCGMEAQETILGYITTPNNKRKIVVGCKDFTQEGGVLYEADKLANAIAPDEEQLRTRIEDVYRIFNESSFIKDKDEIKNKFWDMFVIDALIANKDRHLGNWGIIITNGVCKFSPVYDCGSSLSALTEDEEMKDLLNSDGLFKSLEFNEASVYSMNGVRIRYHEIFKTPPPELKEAIKRIVPKIDIGKIHDIIDAVESMPEIRKEYLKKAVSLRYEQILYPALKRSLVMPTQQKTDLFGSNLLAEKKAQADALNAARVVPVNSQGQTEEIEL